VQQAHNPKVEVDAKVLTRFIAAMGEQWTTCKYMDQRLWTADRGGGFPPLACRKRPGSTRIGAFPLNSCLRTANNTWPCTCMRRSPIRARI